MNNYDIPSGEFFIDCWTSVKNYVAPMNHLRACMSLVKSFTAFGFEYIEDAIDDEYPEIEAALDALFPAIDDV